MCSAYEAYALETDRTKEELYDATVLYYTEATKKSHLSTERVP